MKLRADRNPYNYNKIISEDEIQASVVLNLFG